MTAKIDIKTPAGKSLEGFPRNFSIGEIGEYPQDLWGILRTTTVNTANMEIKPSKGDIITIEVL